MKSLHRVLYKEVIWSDFCILKRFLWLPVDSERMSTEARRPVRKPPLYSKRDRVALGLAVSLEMSTWVCDVLETEWSGLADGQDTSKSTDSQTRALIRDLQFHISAAWKCGILWDTLGQAGVGQLGSFQMHPQDGTKIYSEAKLQLLPLILLPEQTHPHCPSLFFPPSPVPNFSLSQFKQQIFTRRLLYVILTEHQNQVTY